MKMETPKMDVVRFQEADVIVASGVVTPVSLTGFADGEKGNGVVSFTNSTGSYSFRTSDYSRDDFVNAIIGAGVANVPFNDSADPDFHTIGGMYHADNEDIGESSSRSLLLPDGTYAWNGFTYQHQ